MAAGRVLQCEVPHPCLKQSSTNRRTMLVYVYPTLFYVGAEFLVDCSYTKHAGLLGGTRGFGVVGAAWSETAARLNPTWKPKPEKTNELNGRSEGAEIHQILVLGGWTFFLCVQAFCLNVFSFKQRCISSFSHWLRHWDDWELGQEVDLTSLVLSLFGNWKLENAEYYVAVHFQSLRPEYCSPPPPSPTRARPRGCDDSETRPGRWTPRCDETHTNLVTLN